MQSLQNDLQTLNAKLAKVKSSSLKSASQEQEAAAGLIKTLQSRTNSLAVQLKEANDNATKSEQRLKDYEFRVNSMEGTLMQSLTNVEARENELTTLKNTLAAVKAQAEDP